MKTPQKFAIAAAILLSLVLLRDGARAQTSSPKTNWEYWTTHGPAGTVMPALDAQLKQGFEIDRLETTPRPQGYIDAYIVAVLRRAK